MRHYIIPLFIPHFGCPHHCVFCNQRKITGIETDITPEKVGTVIDQHLQQITRPYQVEAAFYGGSFTALPMALQQSLLAPATARLREAGAQPGELPARIDAIRLSTRPDCIRGDILAMLWLHGVRTIELGAQSFADAVLRQSERAHTADDIRTAAQQIKAYGFQLGIQLMPGLPGDTAETMHESLLETLALQPDMVRIYPTVVIRDTKLAALYQKGCYQPLSLQKAASIAAWMKLSFEQAGIEVIRTGLQSSVELDAPGTVLAGPYHPAFGELAESCLFRAMTEALLARLPKRSGRVVLHHAPQDTSRLRGLKNANVQAWQRRYPALQIILAGDGSARDVLCAEQEHIWYTMHKKMLL